MKIASRKSGNFTLLRIFAALTVVCGFLTTATPAFAANTEQVLYSFQDGTDGAYPEAPLIFDGNGNLYGTNQLGGAYGYGAVFELSPSNGVWTETTLHSFNFNGTDGFGPSGLVFDESGNLYGTTSGGGTGTTCGQGCGTVFELSPAGRRCLDGNYSLQLPRAKVTAPYPDARCDSRRKRKCVRDNIGRRRSGSWHRLRAGLRHLDRNHPAQLSREHKGWIIPAGSA